MSVDKRKKWSGEVTSNEKWHSPPGLFTKPPEEIAQHLKENSRDERQAMSRITFYENRAGKNLGDEDRERLEKAKEELRKAYRENES